MVKSLKISLSAQAVIWSSSSSNSIGTEPLSIALPILDTEETGTAIKLFLSFALSVAYASISFLV